MLYGIGKVLQGTDRSLLLRRVLRGAIALCHVREDYLHVALCAQCARLKEGLAIVYTPTIHVQSWEWGEGHTGEREEGREKGVAAGGGRDGSGR